MSNREWVFVSRPGPSGVSAANFDLQSCPEPPPPAEGELCVACSAHTSSCCTSQLQQPRPTRTAAMHWESRLVAPHLFSMDPTMRNAMAGPTAAERVEGSSYYGSMNWTPGEVPMWIVAALVLESGDEAFQPGDFVTGRMPWRERSCIPA